MGRNRNGFTLVELLAVIVILGIIMLIAVPNVVGVIDNNRKETYLSDAKKMVTMAEYATRTNTSILMPNNGEVTVLRLLILTMEILQRIQKETIMIRIVVILRLRKVPMALMSIMLI